MSVFTSVRYGFFNKGFTKDPRKAKYGFFGLESAGKTTLVTQLVEEGYIDGVPCE